MAARIFPTLSDFRDAVGEELGTSEWHTVTQEQVDLFADATGDHQWIHVDPERAEDGPVRADHRARLPHAVAAPRCSAARSTTVADTTLGVNYGANKIRFPSPVPVGSRVRATATLTGIADIAIGTQATITFVVEIEGAPKPALIAEVIYVMAV